MLKIFKTRPQFAEQLSEQQNEPEDDIRDWLDTGSCTEGQLSIDVFETADDLIVKSTIAGARPEDIDISINNDMLTIRGTRQMEEEINEESYLYRECYWGAFSRSIILPIEIQEDKVDALLENGVLTIVMPKAKVGKQISIKIKE